MLQKSKNKTRAGGEADDCLTHQPKDPWSAEDQGDKEELPHLPNPIYGSPDDADLPVGYWARRAKACQWSVAIKHLANDKSLINRLIALPLKREVRLQGQIKNQRRGGLDGEKLDQQLGRYACNIEALLGFVVGERVYGKEACRHCRQLDGHFAGCVRMPGEKHCAPCHWGFQSSRCSFLGDGKQPKKPKNSNPDGEVVRMKREVVQTLKDSKEGLERIKKTLEAGTPPRD